MTTMHWPMSLFGVGAQDEVFIKRTVCRIQLKGLMPGGLIRGL